MDIGKLSQELLDKYVLNVIGARGVKRGETKTRAGFGEDCAVLDIGDEYLSVSSDPITAAEKNIGRLAVHVNANDIAASGCEPVGITITLLMPPGCKESDIETIMNDTINAANEIGVEIVGGHTEVTDAVNRPVISAAVFGKSAGKKFVSSSGAKTGQDLIMTKWAGLEGTAILADCAKDKLCAEFGVEFVMSALKRGGALSVTRESRIAMTFGATAMHDVTEGGVFGACYEMAAAAKVGVEIFAENIPVLPETHAICDFMEINPFKLISSGSLLIAASEGEKLATLLLDRGVEAAVIGRFTPRADDRFVIFKNGRKKLERPAADEIYKAFGRLTRPG
ncbi:MAG: AIR synthase family protein [Clostridiales bacterium]|jgi:hydrogenase maturation factor|nr:AIR synthase family protein [Clostridiales bacterium]